MSRCADKINLFCIPFSGGNTYSYFEFRKYLSDEIELLLPELPGRGKRISDPLLDSIEAMTEDLYKQIEGKTESDYAIFGHSLGALLGYALCKKLTHLNMRLPKHLIVSGQTAPSLIKPENRHALPDEDFLNIMREMGGTPEELLADKSFIQFFLPIIRADFRSVSSYKYVPMADKLDLPITVMLGDREDIKDEEAQRWNNETKIPVKIHRFEGGHFFIYNNIKKVCGLIENVLLK